MEEIKKKAIDVLTREDELFYWDMIDPILNLNAEILDADDNGVMVNIQGVWYLMAKTIEKAEEYAQFVSKHKKKDDGICAHNEILLDPVSKACNCTWFQTPCFVFVGLEKEITPIDTDLGFRRLDHSFDEFVANTYTYYKNDPERLDKAKLSIDLGMYGGFKDEKPVGFIGMHNEGTMGMLEILPEFRRRGYGKALEQHLANTFIEDGRRPFCHVLETNVASLALQKELGFVTRESKRVYWMG